MPLRPNAREPGLVRDYGGVKRGEFGALLDLLAVLVAGVDLRVRLANLQGEKIFCTGSVRSELGRDINEWRTRIIKSIISKFWATDPVSGAQTTLYCALQENIEHLSGRYFSDCQLVQVKPEARDDGIAKKLWDISEKFCGMA
ncbi:dehydrogenase reductase SDR family member 13-like protein [Labeo rohita]|uniref:Dehydrogenase reductase SDR family member 13-like protein n=1 Tax=Labeo rohita TaxID=84645 RepID=A0A498N8D5_LABRO|nr:dehydrogenase reductase SDR family member 13-like protein [Labeo rohita]